jgi:tetratricopeptide (TPR) repeat protein
MRFLARFFILFSLALPSLHGQVRVWEGTLPLTTSDEGLPDENPPFDIFATDRFSYPYTMRENVRNTETVHQWRAVYLENEYLKCTILRDLGGHIYTCVDKVNGKPMFYANPSFKKALIGYRGAWTTFGVEFNFPVSHNWISVSPVDWSYGSKTDGSASVTVGNRDRVYGMEWTVELAPRPGSTVLEERVTLANRSDLRHRFYWWNNAGVEVWNDSRILYPMQFTASHGFTNIDTWPVDSKGMDLSLISNQTDGPVSRFIYGSHEPFMGIYNPHTDAGVVHYANYSDLPAKKIWSWGVDEDGLAWRSALSDNDSAYVEVQAGLLRNQETYSFLEPRQSIHFSEFWMPVRAIGGISRANLNGVVSLSRKVQADGRITLTAAFNANQEISKVRLQILDGKTLLFEETTSLDPVKTWSHQLENLPPDHKYTFLLRNDKDELLLEHTEGVYDWTPRDQVQTGPQAAHTPPSKDKWTDGDFLEQGTDEELQGSIVAAWETYQQGLAKFPSSFELLKASGRLAVDLLRYEEAAIQLSRVEARATWDAEAHYYRGIAEAGLGHRTEARTEFEAANRSPSLRAASGLLLAESLAQDHDIAGALRILASSCPSVSDDQRCVEETVALERAVGDVDRARNLAKQSLARYPTSSFLQNELSIMGSSAAGLDRHLAADSSRILNLVTQYDRLGLYSHSLELLSRHYPSVGPDESEPGAAPPADDPILTYYRGYCREQLGQSGRDDFEAASRMSLRYIFPSRAETIPVLRAALASNPSDASAHFLLGSLWFSRGIVDPAIEEWRRAASLNPNIPSLDASLGRALLLIKKQPIEASSVFQHGFLVDPSNSALYIGLDQAMQQTGQSASKRAAMLQKFPDTVSMPAELVRAQVNALREDGKNEQADALLREHFLSRQEGLAPLQPLSTSESSSSPANKD